MIWLLCLVVFLFGFAVFFGAPYVPSKKGDLEQALTDLYPIGPSDTLVDIGSGDGIVLRQAAKRGAKAVGYEINPFLVLISRFLSHSSPNVTTHFANFWKATLPKETTVVYTFGDSRDIAKMTKKVQDTANQIGRPVAFISYGFDVPGMTPKKQLGAHYLYELAPLQMKQA